MKLSLIFPVYNEEEALPELFKAIRPVLDRLEYDHELIFVNDGSRDATGAVLDGAAALDSRIKVLHFSRNFGHQAAVTAGLDFADGDAVAVMDADLQDPPELLPKMLEKYEQGYDVVSAQRTSRSSDTLFKRWTASVFYTLMRKAVDPRLTPQVGDFRLFSREAVRAVRQFREQHRFMRGLVAWLGLREAIVPFTRAPRVAGTTKYPFWKMCRFAWTAISSFSALPLKLTLLLGLFLSTLGAFYAAYVVYETLVLQTTVRGWSSLVCLQILFSGTILTAIGLMGDYLARIYEESKGRPLYVISHGLNLEAMEGSPSRVAILHRRAPLRITLPTTVPEPVISEMVNHS